MKANDNIKGRSVGDREYRSEWEDIQNSLKNGRVKVIKPPTKLAPAKKKD